MNSKEPLEGFSSIYQLSIQYQKINEFQTNVSRLQEIILLTNDINESISITKHLISNCSILLSTNLKYSNEYASNISSLSKINLSSLKKGITVLDDHIELNEESLKIYKELLSLSCSEQSKKDEQQQPNKEMTFKEFLTVWIIPILAIILPMIQTQYFQCNQDKDDKNQTYQEQILEQDKLQTEYLKQILYEEKLQSEISVKTQEGIEELTSILEDLLDTLIAQQSDIPVENSPDIIPSNSDTVFPNETQVPSD